MSPLRTIVLIYIIMITICGLMVQSGPCGSKCANVDDVSNQNQYTAQNAGAQIPPRPVWKHLFIYLCNLHYSAYAI